MTTLRCIIVDDEPLAVKLLESFVARTPQLQLVASFTDAAAALAAMPHTQAHLAFLDIQMPDVDGLELARAVPPATRIVFTTAFKEYALDSYEVAALDYLLKPVRYSKFLAAVEKARQWFQRQSPPAPPEAHSLFIKVDGELRQVDFAHIVYVSGMKDYVVFHLDDQRKPLVTHLTMKAVEEMLPRERFLRVHRSYIVALDHIRKVDRNDCIYIGDDVVHVTDAYLDDFRQYLAQRSPTATG